MTACGPKLIEINARMGGFYLREWIIHLYGVDPMVCAIQVSCGVKPYIPLSPPDECLMGIMLIPSKHKLIWQRKESRKALQEMHDNGEIIITQFGEDLEEISESLEEPYANIAVRAKTVAEAKEKLLKLCERFEITTESYVVKDFLNYF